jgi:primosomal protein N' (replication factor Y)
MNELSPTEHRTPNTADGSMPSVQRVRVAFDGRLDQLYDYRVPPQLAPLIAVGTRVQASLGRAVRTGYVIALDPPEEAGIAYKEIRDVSEPEPVVTSSLLQLAQFIAEYYACPLGTVLRSCLPAAVRHRTAAAVQVHVVRPARPLDELRAHAAALGPRAPRQAGILRHVVEFYQPAAAAAPQHGPTRTDTDTSPLLRLSELTARAECPIASVRALEKQGWLVIALEKHWRDAAEDEVVPAGAPSLTAAQQTAVDAIRAARDRFRVFLLHGVTGSGKTEVYLRVIDDALQRGKGAIVLVPEIALTPQTVERFRARFGARVAVLHSDLPEFERCRQWWSIRDGAARIVVGARSAIFAPVRDLGVIVVDEEHEHTYKQAEEQPRYHARDVAVVRAQLEHCPVILGSATPALESMLNVRKKKYMLLSLPERVAARAMPTITLVDMRAEARVAPQLGIVSRTLRAALDDCLRNREQALLFLNRRGYCPILTCPSCGYVKRCAACAVSLTYHATRQRLMCHLCGHHEAYSPPYHCPDCRAKLNLCGFGTQRVEKHLAYLFPQARIARMDRDTTSTRGSHERILNAFSLGAIDLLLGTQMIAKGLDFPNVTVVGVINADTSLHVPDFRAAEVTCQLITQVAGRAGRGAKPGVVIVQSFTPDAPAVRMAVAGDWPGFAAAELRARRDVSYPPFAHFVNLLVKGRDEAAVITKARDLTHDLTAAVQRSPVARHGIFAVLGPAPAPLAMAHGYHRWQVTVKTHAVRAALAAVAMPIIRAARAAGLEIIVDADPI